MIIRSGREDIAVTARRCPRRTIEKQYGVRLELGIGPGIMRHLSLNMVVVVGDAEIVHGYRVGKGDDLGL